MKLPIVIEKLVANSNAPVFQASKVYAERSNTARRRSTLGRLTKRMTSSFRKLDEQSSKARRRSTLGRATSSFGKFIKSYSSSKTQKSAACENIENVKVEKLDKLRSKNNRSNTSFLETHSVFHDSLMISALRAVEVDEVDNKKGSNNNKNSSLHQRISSGFFSVIFNGGCSDKHRIHSDPSLYLEDTREWLLEMETFASALNKLGTKPENVARKHLMRAYLD